MAHDFSNLPTAAHINADTVDTAAMQGVSMHGAGAWERAAATAKLLGMDPPPRLKNGDLDTKCFVRVCSPRTLQVIVCGITVERGTFDYECYRSQIPEFTKLVETASQADRDLARRMHERDLRTAEDAKNKVEGAPEYRRPYWPSYSAAFRDLFGRSLLPFESVTLLESSDASTPSGPIYAAASTDPSRIPTSTDAPASPKSRKG